MERLVWLESAITDLARLRKFIDKNNPNAAKRVAEVIKKAVIKLIEFPLIGKPVTNLIDYRDLFDLVYQVIYYDIEYMMIPFM